MRTVEVYLQTVILAVLVASVVLPALVRAVDYSVGVKAGDWVKYGQFTVNWTGNGTEPSYVAEEKKIQWTRIDVENVSGTTITFSLTTQFNNGTQTPQTLTVDVANSSMSGFFFIASNLKSSDRITNGMISTIINETTTGTYAGATRDVNLVSVTTTVFGNLTLTDRVYWDQATGVMVEAYTKAPGYGTPTPDEPLPTAAYVELSAKATETNMWSVDLVGTLSANLVYIVAGVVVIIIVVEAAVFLQRRKPPSAQQRPPPAEGRPPTPP